MTLTDTHISDNTARLRGGGLYNSGIALLTGVTFTRNTADEGGALYNAAAYQAVPSQLTVENSTFWGNVADGLGDGGAIMNLGAATFTNTTVTGNSGTSGGSGGGIYNDGTLTLRNSIVAGNAVDGPDQQYRAAGYADPVRRQHPRRHRHDRQQPAPKRRRACERLRLRHADGSGRTAEQR